MARWQRGYLRSGRHGVGVDGAEWTERGSKQFWEEVDWVKRKDSVASKRQKKVKGWT